MIKMLMGNEAIAYGAIAAGVGVVTGYPGTPSTEVLETVAKQNDGSIYVEWSVNEKVALEIAAGAAYTGVRSMVTMKQVGLNVASDPLMSLVSVGVKGGMVILVADDPGPISSQTEQDTRFFAKYSNLPVFDPSSPEEAYRMAQDAFAYSERYGIPVFLRPTTRICHSCASVELRDDKDPIRKGEFVKDPHFVIFPPLARKRHAEVEEQQPVIAEEFSDYPLNCARGSGPLCVVASGIGAAYAKEVLDAHAPELRLIKIATPFPLPERFLLSALAGVEKILVVEELDPVIEEGLIELAYRHGLSVEILGKKTGNLPKVSEFSYEIVRDAVAAFAGLSVESGHPVPPENLPTRPPVLCAGCPHRASFYAVKLAMKGQRAVFTGDIGCYTLGNAKPLDMCDTCLCMGASLTIAQGLKRADPDAKYIGFIGDSTFFHTGIPGVVNALYNGTDITLAILDNSTTAMTGHQPHPGIGKTMMGGVSPKIDIAALLRALGVGFVEKVNPFELERAVDTVRRATEHQGVSTVIFEAPCIAVFKKDETYRVNDRCKKCGACLRELGCPAMSRSGDGRAVIEPSLCYGCGLCASVCKFGALEPDSEKDAR